MTGIEVVKDAISKLPIEIATGTVTKDGNVISVADFLENNLAPYMNDKTPEDVIIFVNTRLKKYITEAHKVDVEIEPEYTTYQVEKPVITREETIIQVEKPTITFSEPEKVEEETSPFVITSKIPKVTFEKLSELNEKKYRINSFFLSDPKYSEEHRISPTETNSFKQFMDLYPMELVDIENGILTIKMGDKRVTLEEAYEKFMAPINLYEEETLQERFQTVIGEIVDIMNSREIDDRNKEILFKSKTSNGKTFFDYIKEDILPTVSYTYDGPNGENLHTYLDRILGMQIAFDNERVNTNNNVSPDGNTLDEVNKVGEIKILDGSITSEMLTLLTNAEKNSINANLQLSDDEKLYIIRFEQLEVGIKLITDHDDLEVKYAEFTNLVSEAKLKCPDSSYIKTLVDRINITYENKNKSLKTINETKETFKMMFDNALDELKYRVGLVSTFDDLVEARIQVKAFEEKMTSLGFTNNAYQASMEHIKTILEARSLQVQQTKIQEEVNTLAV